MSSYQGLVAAGTVSRAVNSVIETVCSGATASPKAGTVAKLEVLNGVSILSATKVGDTAEVFYGVVTISTGLQFDKTSGFGLPNTPHSVLVDGYVNVKCVANTPVRGRKVYVNVLSGEFSAAATLPEAAPPGTVEWPQAKWATDGFGINGFGEIRLAK
jgi:hypothetical protein